MFQAFLFLPYSHTVQERPQPDPWPNKSLVIFPVAAWPPAAVREGVISQRHDARSILNFILEVECGEGVGKKAPWSPEENQTHKD